MKALKAKESRSGRAYGGPDPIPVLAYLAARYLRYGPLDRARSLYGLLISLKPRQRNFRIALGYACFKSGRAEEALAHLEAAYKGRTGLTGWEILLLGRTLRANGMMDESRELIERHLKGQEQP
jgi:tetratricopeptide (TPR) repeat protein